MTRGTRWSEWVRLPRPRPAFREVPERKFLRSLQGLCFRRNRKAEGRRAAGRRKDPERVPEPAESSEVGSEHGRIRDQHQDKRSDNRSHACRVRSGTHPGQEHAAPSKAEYIAADLTKLNLAVRGGPYIMRTGDQTSSNAAFI